MNREATYRVTVGEAAFDITVTAGQDHLIARVGDATLRVAWRQHDAHRGVLVVEDRALEVLLAETLQGTTVWIDGYEAATRVIEGRALQLAASLPSRADGGGRIEIRAPMPGRVVAVRVGAGDVVERNAPVAILEAMKMENELRAPSPGRVRDVQIAVGDAVEHGALLMILDPIEAG